MLQGVHGEVAEVVSNARQVEVKSRLTFPVPQLRPCLLQYDCSLDLLVHGNSWDRKLADGTPQDIVMVPCRGQFQ
jgi:hypothetical protein